MPRSCLVCCRGFGLVLLLVFDPPHVVPVAALIAAGGRKIEHAVHEAQLGQAGSERTVGVVHVTIAKLENACPWRLGAPRPVMLRMGEKTATKRWKTQPNWTKAAEARTKVRR